MLINFKCDECQKYQEEEIEVYFDFQDREMVEDYTLECEYCGCIKQITLSLDLKDGQCKN
ncbi:hypothetical protein B6S12_07560 [Helicobacter valdiviensis]|uniref:CPXCG motif-containing cysteine-rich protein n=1 Tax=Helicobacter valdiviensis TaxID=1458358 RepID=A0A2W6MUW3_9HELI|nr:hypothetical protein [Helicobacter valdiviensis]PZT47709.1 hypothetical protein B6S12_07560 [Helicobacter valdiviensis]